MLSFWAIAGPQVSKRLPIEYMNVQTLWSEPVFQGCGKSCWGNGEGSPWSFIPSPHHCCRASLTTFAPCSVSWFIVKSPASAQLRSRLTPHRTRFYCATLCPDFPWQPQACFSELKPRKCSVLKDCFPSETRACLRNKPPFRQEL